MGCTTGAKVLRPDREYILFKNRDFTRESLEDRISLTDKAFGALGLETWDGNDPERDRLSGFSIGFNAHLACCDSNVRTVSGGDNYDKLVQAVVENCTTIKQAVDCVQTLVRDRLFCWANMIVATKQGVAALEVRDHHVEVERNPVCAARANHHVRLGATPDDDDPVTTFTRFQSAHDGLKAAGNLNDVFHLLRSHDPDAQHSICNHATYYDLLRSRQSRAGDRGFYNTVYSYLVHWNEGETTLYVLQGHPCDGIPYTKLPIRFDQTNQINDLSRYPSKFVGKQAVV